MNERLFSRKPDNHGSRSHAYEDAEKTFVSNKMSSGAKLGAGNLPACMHTDFAFDTFFAATGGGAARRGAARYSETASTHLILHGRWLSQ